VKPLNLDLLHDAVAHRRIQWRKHAIREVLLNEERIHDYTEDRPFPSALFLGYIGDKPLHVMAAFDEMNKHVFVITAYEPSLDVFEADYRTRRRS
jgi:hypothetical protein